MNKEILKLNNIDQSVWIDSISRGMINTGKIKSMVENGVSGITSNPSIFQKALSNEDSYDEEIKLLTESGINDPKQIFHKLSIKDISDACKILLPVYEKKERGDEGVKRMYVPLPSAKRGMYRR